MGSSQRLTLLIAADGEHVNHVLGLRCQPGQSEVVPGGGKPFLPGSPTARLLKADPVAGDGGFGRQPVDGEGVGPDVGEVQFGRGVQNWKRGFWRVLS